MLMTSSSPDATSRAALRLLMERLPDMSAMENGGMAIVEPAPSTEPPMLRSAQVVEGSSVKAQRIPGLSRQMASGFSAFLDGAQRVQIMGHQEGIPVVYATVSAAVRVRVNRRLLTWGHRPPRVERRFFLPLRYLPSLRGIVENDSVVSGLRIVDTSKADKNGEFPSPHPTSLIERALRSVDELRQQLEHALAEEWCATSDAPIFIDGGISGNPRVASSSGAVGVIKSHRTLYVEEDALKIVLGLNNGERSSLFRVSPRSRSLVISWYLRVRDARGHDPLWGLVRVEIAERDKPTDRADEISRWVIAEMSPLSLPDGRWDKMAYGVRDCEEFLRAIS